MATPSLSTAELSLAAEAMAFELHDHFGLTVSLAVRAANHMLNGVAFAEAWQKARYEEDALVGEMMTGSTERGRAASLEVATRLYYKLNPAGEVQKVAPMSMQEGAALITSKIAQGS